MFMQTNLNQHENKHISQQQWDDILQQMKNAAI
jgi:hypothetical protein